MLSGNIIRIIHERDVFIRDLKSDYQSFILLKQLIITESGALESPDYTSLANSNNTRLTVSFLKY